MSMNRRLPAILAVAVMVAILLTPAGWSGSEAIEEDQFILRIPNYSEDTLESLELGNGSSYSLHLYFLNKSDHALDVDIQFWNFIPEVKFLEETINFSMMPAGDPDHGDIVEKDATIAVDELCPTYIDTQCLISINVTDLEDGTTLYYAVKVYVNVYSAFDSSSSYNKFFGIFNNEFGPPLNSSVFPFLVTLIGLIIGTLAVSILVVPAIARRLDKYTRGKDEKKLGRILISVIMVCAVMLFISPGLEILGTDLKLLLTITQLSRAILILVSAVSIWRIYTMVIEGILSQYKGRADSTIDLSMLPLFLMLGKLAISIVSIVLILTLYGVDIQGILISAGVVSLGITLGAQPVLSQFFSGLVLLSTRPFETGDILEIDGKTLRVKKVKVMYTEFYSLPKDSVVIMPNNAVTAATIVNHDMDDKAHFVTISIPVPFGTDLKRATEVILHVAEADPDVVVEPDGHRRTVKLVEFQSSAMILELSAYLKDYRGSFTICARLRMQMYESLREAGIMVPFERLEVTLKNECFNADYISKPTDSAEES